MFHLGCGGRIAISLPNTVMAELEPTVKGLRISQITFTNKLIAPKNFKLVCTSCNDEVKSDKIVIMCNHCGNHIKLTDAVFLNDMEGHYCAECVARRYKSATKISFSEKIISVILNPRNSDYR